MSEQTMCDNCGKIITSAMVWTREDSLGMDFCTKKCRDTFDLTDADKFPQQAVRR